MRVISAMRREFGVPVPMKVLFERPTVAALADEVLKLQEGDGQKVAVAGE